MPLNVNTGGGILATTNFSPNEYELLADYTVSDSAITSYTFSGLKLNADEEMVLVFDAVNATASITGLRLYVNGNTTDTNYYRQVLFADGTTVGGNRNNYPEIDASIAGYKSFVAVKIKLTNNGYFVYQDEAIRQYGSSIAFLLNFYGTSTFTLSQITSLTITSSVANTISIGSRFQLYKVKGQVQQTWATT